MEEQKQGNFTPLPSVVNVPANNGITTKPLTGFQLHPENINKDGAPLAAWRFDELIDEEMEEEIEAINSKGVKVKWKKKKVLVKKLVGLAMAGDIKALIAIIEKKDGKAKQSIKLGTEDGEPFIIEFHHSLQHEQK